MFTLVPNFNYEKQSEECKDALCKEDFMEVCSLIHTKHRMRLQSMICPTCGKRLFPSSYVCGRNHCNNCNVWFENPNETKLQELATNRMAHQK